MSKMACEVENLVWNPYWVGMITLFLFRNSLRRLCRSFSNILEKQVKMVMGRVIGVIYITRFKKRNAILQLSRNIPLEKAKSIKMLR